MNRLFERMNVGRIGKCCVVWLVIITVIVFVVACRNSPNRPGSNPIATDRVVEYLDLTPGEIPQWKKKGEITLPIGEATKKP